MMGIFKETLFRDSGADVHFPIAAAGCLFVKIYKHWKLLWKGLAPIRETSILEIYI